MTRSNFYLAGFVILLLAIVTNTVLVLGNIEQVRSDEAHTRHVQVQGAPTGVCLREAARAALPILVDGADALERGAAKASPAARAQIELFVHLARSVERPLSEYVALQSKRYVHVVCPGAKR
jgi:hypothetical protein